MTISAVTLSEKHLAIIRALTINGTSGKHWEDPTLSDVKSHIKTYYINAQANRCCYCNRFQASKGHRHWDAEHIVPRSSHANFTFEPLNLAAACPECNTSKSDKPVLKNQRRKTYPKKSSDFTIIHPHYDNFSDNIFVLGEFIYVGKTEKGKKTIYQCDLLRYAQNYIDWTTSISDTSFERTLTLALSGDLKELKYLLDAIRLLKL